MHPWHCARSSNEQLYVLERAWNGAQGGVLPDDLVAEVFVRVHPGFSRPSPTPSPPSFPINATTLPATRPTRDDPRLRTLDEVLRDRASLAPPGDVGGSKVLETALVRRLPAAALEALLADRIALRASSSSNVPPYDPLVWMADCCGADDGIECFNDKKMHFKKICSGRVPYVGHLL